MTREPREEVGRGVRGGWQHPARGGSAPWGLTQRLPPASGSLGFPQGTQPGHLCSRRPAGRTAGRLPLWRLRSWGIRLPAPTPAAGSTGEGPPPTPAPCHSGGCRPPRALGAPGGLGGAGGPPPSAAPPGPQQPPLRSATPPGYGPPTRRGTQGLQARPFSRPAQDPQEKPVC